MKFKIVITLFLCLLSTTFVLCQKIVGQSQKTLRNTYQTPQSTNARTSDVDTLALLPPAFDQVCGQSVFDFLNSDDWGFVGGMNDFGDLEKTQRIRLGGISNAKIISAVAFFATAKSVNNGELSMKIYKVNPQTKAPGTLLGTSLPIKVTDIEIDSQFVVPTLFEFAQPIAIQDSTFFVSVDFSKLYASKDTVSVYMSNIGCGDGDDSYELLSNGKTWLPITNDTSWGIDASFLMGAVVVGDILAATKELAVGNKAIRLYDAYPNPAKESTTISFDLEIGTNVQIEIYLLTGQRVLQINKSHLPHGKYQEIIPTKNLASGTYLYGIITNEGRLMNKFSVLK